MFIVTNVVWTSGFDANGALEIVSFRPLFHLMNPNPGAMHSNSWRNIIEHKSFNLGCKGDMKLVHQFMHNILKLRADVSSDFLTQQELAIKEFIEAISIAPLKVHYYSEA